MFAGAASLGGTAGICFDNDKLSHSVWSVFNLQWAAAVVELYPLSNE